MTDLFWGFTTRVQVRLVQDDRRQGRPSLWVGKHRECDFDISAFHDLKGPAGMTERHPVNGEILNLVLSMFQRSIPAYAMSCQTKVALAESYAAWFRRLIRERNLQRVFFTHVPHLGAELLLLDACRELGVSVFMFYQSLFPDAFFIARDFDEIGHFVIENTTAEPRRIEVELGVAEKDLFYMNSIPARTGSVSWVLSIFMRRLSKYLRGKSGGLALSGLYRAYLARRRYEQLPQFFIDQELPEKFVYFGLHMQPELTTNPLGGVFDDQVAAIEAMREWLPADIAIVVKENPKQDFEQRPGDFYRRLATLDHVILAGRDVNTYDLIRNSLFVSTVTGTLGWEAVTHGKAALVFGHAWYGELPGVFQLTPDLAVSELISFRQDFTLLRQKLDELQGKLFPGLLDMGYLELVPDYDFDLNLEKIACAIAACREHSNRAGLR